MTYLVIDTETSGLDPVNYDLLTLYMAVVDFFEDYGGDVPYKYVINTKKSLSLNLRPAWGQDYRVDPEAMAINKIDLVAHDKIAMPVAVAAMTVEHFLKSVRNSEDDKIDVIGWNPTYDTGFLFHNMPNTQKYFGHSNIDIKSLALVYRDIEKPILTPKANLSGFARHFGFDPSKAHNAEEDCKLAISVLNKLVECFKIY